MQDSESNTLTTELFRPPQTTSLICDWYFSVAAHQTVNVDPFPRTELRGAGTLTLDVLYHTIPHELCRCEVKDVHGLQSFVSTHSEKR